MAPSHGFDFTAPESLLHQSLYLLGGSISLIDSLGKVGKPLFYKWKVGIKPPATLAQTFLVASDRY